MLAAVDGAEEPVYRAPQAGASCYLNTRAHSSNVARDFSLTILALLGVSITG